MIPMVVAAIITTSLLDQSLSYTTTEELSRLSQSLEDTGRDYYVQARDGLKEDAHSGAIKPETFSVADRSQWPIPVREFWESGEPERFSLAGTSGDRIDYLVREAAEVRFYSRSLGKIHLDDLRAQIRNTRQLVGQAEGRDLRRGLTAVLMILMAAVWGVSFLALVYVANRISRPIQQLTTALSQLPTDKLPARIETKRNDEIGRAIDAFNQTAGELEQSRNRLVYLTQIASWQVLAKKMAHELKNSLTPIRLTVEEILAREPAAERQFMEKAVRIVVSEVESLERRVRAFSDFSSEPSVHLSKVELNPTIEERIAFLRTAHANVTYTQDLDAHIPPVVSDTDRIKGILTNLLENAAEATNDAGKVLVRSFVSTGKACIEIHDSGPGLSEEARRTLFEPTITFKNGGMGLGLSIARKDALLCGGDLMLVEGKLGGAGFRLVLPVV